MSRARWLVVLGTITVMLGMQALEIAVGGERWPFARYAMYASHHPPHITWRQVYGVSGGREFPLNDPKFHPPIDDPRLSYSLLERTHLRAGAAIPDRDAMLRVVASLYERARQEERHEGPPLTAIRLYSDTWELRRDLANRGTPEVHELVAEVRLGR